MGNFIVISVFAKLSDPEQTFVEANRTVVSGHFYMRYFSLFCFFMNFCNLEMKYFQMK